jgi:6-phosphogluconolactonase
MIEATRVFDGRDELAETLARDVADELLRAIEAKGRATLAVSGGTTPRLFFEHLSRAQIPWSRVTVTLVDERLVPEDDARSNARLVKQGLLRNAAADATFVPLYRNPQAAGLPPFDVAILGMGLDGHTASYFPGGDRLGAALDEHAANRIVEINAPGAGEPRITFTLPSLLSAGRLKLHIEGQEKRQVLDKALGEGPDEAMPVRAVLRSAAPLTLYWCP